jgi:hypothetical protein
VTRPLSAAALTIVALVSLVALAACGSDDKPTVYVFGDSLVSQATTYLQDQLRHDGFTPHVASLSGAATCDLSKAVGDDKQRFDPDVAVMSFSGNALGPCMRDAQGRMLTGDAYLAKYRADTERMLRRFGDDVPFYLVGAPISGGGDDRVYRLYQEIARKHPNTHFVDGGKCLRGEPCTGPVVDGVRTNVVRSPDHAHFCPIDPGFGKPCPQYSSGAYRFARAIAEAVDRGER